MDRTKIAWIRPYISAVLAVFLALTVKSFIQPYISTSPPFITFLAAIMFTAWHWGFQPALFATVLSAIIIDYRFFAPINSFGLGMADAATLAFFCVVATVMAYAIHHLQNARREAVAAQRQLQHLHELSTQLLNEEDFERALQRVLTAAMELIGAPRGVIQVYDPKNHVFQIAAQVGFNQEFFNYFQCVPIDFSTCGAAFQRKQRVIIENIATDPVFSQLAPLFSPYEVISVQSTPLFCTDRRVFGVLSTYFSKAHVPSEGEFWLLDLYVRQAERVLEVKRQEKDLLRAKVDLEQRVMANQQQLLQADERLQDLISELAVTEERQRHQLASELHDYLAQLLTLGQIKLKLARQFLGPSPVQSEHYMQEAAEALKRALEYSRTLMAELCPPELHESGLFPAVRWLAGHMSKHGLIVELHSNADSVTVPDDQAVLLYKSVRELLINVVKHAGVGQATVSLVVDSDNTLTLSVQDAGRGFDASSAGRQREAGHFGLSSIRDRMAALGGWLREETTIGRGTKITLGLPLQPPLTTVHSFHAASGLAQDRVKVKTVEHVDQQDLPYR